MLLSTKYSRNMGPKKVPRYRLTFHRKAEKFLGDLEEKEKQNLLEDINCLSEFSGLKSRLDIVRLQGQKDFFRLRSGRLRTVFWIDQKSKSIIILKIEKRESVYE